MSKIIHQCLFKTVFVSFFAFVHLFTCNVTWGGGVVIPVMLSNGELFPVKMTCPDNTLDVYTDYVVPSTGQPVFVEHTDTSALSFPLSVAPILIGFDGTIVSTSGWVYASDVDRFFDNVYIPAGFTRPLGSTASLAMNCHGYATGKNRWLKNAGLNTVLSNDYTYHDWAFQLVGANEGIMALDDCAHSVVVEIIPMTVAGTSGIQLAVTREKFNASAIYEKNIEQNVYAWAIVALYIAADIDPITFKRNLWNAIGVYVKD